MNMMKKVACDFWGLPVAKYKFYDENVKEIIAVEEQRQIDQRQNLTVDKHFETSGAKS